MFIELSYEIHEHSPVYPGSPPEAFIAFNRMIKGDKANASQISHYLHTGTHVDAPFHFFNKGQTINEIPIEDFVYEKPLVIHRFLRKSELLSTDDLKKHGDELFSTDLLLFYTGYCHHRGDSAVYVDDFPAVSEAAARFIRTELINVKAVAIDTLSIESPTSGPAEHFKVHKTFLDGDLYETRPLLIYEDVNIGIVAGKKIKRIYAFPLRLRGLEASPVNMVAETAA
jgi:kynurenine formamidase